MRHFLLTLLLAGFSLNPLLAEEELPPEPQNVKLVLSLLPFEDDDGPKAIVSAGGEYLYSVTFKNRETTMSYEVEGELEFIEHPKYDIRLTYDAELRWKGDGNDATFRCKGSVLLPFGASQYLGVLGEKKLMVEVWPAGINEGKKEEKIDRELEEKKPVPKEEKGEGVF